MKVPTLPFNDLGSFTAPEFVVRRTWNMLNDESYFLLTGVAAVLTDVDAAWEASRQYFLQPTDVKLADYIGHSDDHHGYVPMGEEGKSGEHADYKESFDCGWNPPPAIESAYSGYWPNSPGFGLVIANVWRQMRYIAEHLAQLFSLMLGEPQDYLQSQATNPPSQLRLLHYMGDDPARVAVDWHTDYECFTLLATTTPGLEVRRADGSVTRVPFQPDSLVVTVGDLMEVLTNGGLRATDHRVMPLEAERYSIAYFHALDWASRVAPLPKFVGQGGSHYPDIVAGDHLLQRTNDGFSYRRDNGGTDRAENMKPLSPYFYDRGSAGT